MGTVFLDALIDTLKVVPFLVVIYVVIELIEHKTSLTGNRKILQGRLSPLIGSVAGLIPLCGFSVMAAKLYDRGYIRTGALLAVFIATSDEAVILLLSDVDNLRSLSAVLPLILIKFVLAVAVGYAAYILLSREKTAEMTPEDHSADYECAHARAESTNLQTYLWGPLWHTLKVSLYLFAINVVFGLIIYFVGMEKIAASLAANIWLQPLITSAVGLIPSCASSVVLTSAFSGGIITFGSMTAGLIVNAGMGFMILFRNVKKIGRTLAIAGALFVVAYLAGVAVNSIFTLIPPEVLGRLA